MTPTEAHVVSYAERLLLQHGLLNWTVVLDRATTRAGQCRHGKRQISLSRPLIKVRTLHESLMTVKHEVAHAIVGAKHGHDATWRDQFIALGGDGKRCFELDQSANEKLQTKYVGICPSGHKTALGRQPTLQRSCSECNPRRFTERYLLRIVERATGVEVGYAPRKPKPLRKISSAG